MLSRISLDQCSGVDYLDFLACGICGGLAVRPRIHNGGYGQDFCHKLYCLHCVGLYSDNPAVHKRVLKKFQPPPVPGRRREPQYETIVSCPDSGCLMNFNDPYFTKLGLLEENVISNVMITCLNCSGKFLYYRFLTHQVDCVFRRQSFVSANQLLDANLVSIGRDLMVGQQQKAISFNSAGNDINIININNSLINLSVHCYGKSDLSFELSSDLSVDDFLKIIGDKSGLDPNGFDVVAFSHQSVRQFSFLGDFIKSIGHVGKFNLMRASPDFMNRNNHYCITINGFQESSYGQIVPSVELINNNNSTDLTVNVEDEVIDSASIDLSSSLPSPYRCTPVEVLLNVQSVPVDFSVSVDQDENSPLDLSLH